MDTTQMIADLALRDAPASAFPAFVNAQDGYQVRLDKPFKNKTGTFTVMVQFPNGGRQAARGRMRWMAIAKAIEIGRNGIASKIAQGQLS